MAMDGNQAAAPRFTVGGVISTSLSVIAANILRFLAIMIAVGAPVAVLIGVGIAFLAQDSSAVVTGLSVQVENPNTFEILFIIVSALLTALAYGLILPAITYGTLQTLRGRAPGIGACISNGLAAVPRIILACLLLLFVFALVGGVVFFFLVLILGGLGIGTFILSLVFAAGSLYVVTLVWVFIPAIVGERAGALECLSRSVVLTRGHRWGIFGLLVLLTLANWAIAALNQMLTVIAPTAGAVIDIAIGMFFMTLSAVMAAVGYYYLRAEKEGVAIDDVVTVFD
jgi:hypothetical protein